MWNRNFGGRLFINTRVHETKQPSNSLTPVGLDEGYLDPPLALADAFALGRTFGCAA